MSMARQITSKRYLIEEISQVGEVRRAGATMAEEFGFNEEEAGRLSIVITEAATNILKHAGTGSILLNQYLSSGAGVEVLALDRGPGIEDINRSMVDGVSTVGTSGSGLGAIRRQSDFFEIYSRPGQGTALLARVGIRLEKANNPEFSVGAVRCAIPGESICGDDWDFFDSPDKFVVSVADGLGHGVEAAKASNPAVSFLRNSNPPDLIPALEQVHKKLRNTRGAAQAICELSPTTGRARFLGVGNISAVICGGEKDQHLVSMNGTMGHAMRTLQEFSYDWPKHGILIMHSDGLTSRWSLEDFPGLASRDPALIAAVLYRDFFRGRDDATVVVVKSR
jgi:anti-sigma regulatory factor (Ser/Thr protein kinase)